MAQVGGQFIHVQASNQLAHRLCAHPCTENTTKGIREIAEAALLQQIHFLQPLQVTPQSLQTLAFADPLCLQMGQLFVESHQFALASVLIDIGHNVEGKVEDALQVARGKVQQETNTTGGPLEVPDVAHWRSQFDMAHAFTTHS